MNEHLEAMAQLSGRTLADACNEACRGTNVDPKRLAELLADDPGWWNPAAIKRWIRLIEESGWPGE
jgi:hypothetical protein